MDNFSSTKLNMASICYVNKSESKNNGFVKQTIHYTECGNKILHFCTQDIPLICSKCGRRLKNNSGYFLP